MIEYKYQHHGKDYSIRLEQLGSGAYRAQIGERVIEFEVIRGADQSTTLVIKDGERVRAWAAMAQANRSGTRQTYVTVADGSAIVYELTRIVEGARRVS